MSSREGVDALDGDMAQVVRGKSAKLHGQFRAAGRGQLVGVEMHS